MALPRFVPIHFLEGVMIMKCLLALSATVLLMCQASPAVAQVSMINVSGKLSDGSFITATVTVGKTGQITGTGVLYGTNPAANTNYKYPFVISKGATGQGKLILTGQMTAGPAVTLTAVVPNGPIVFSYVVGGKTYTLTGQGTVTVK